MGEIGLRDGRELRRVLGVAGHARELSRAFSKAEEQRIFSPGKFVGQAILPNNLVHFIKDADIEATLRTLTIFYDANACEYLLECFGLRGARMKDYDFYHVAMAHVATNS